MGEKKKTVKPVGTKGRKGGIVGRSDVEEPSEGKGRVVESLATTNPTEEEEARLTPEELGEFRTLLLERRKLLLDQARNTLEAQDPEVRVADDVDQASTEYEKSFEYRLRDREKGLLQKIEKALERIESGEYDLCESCGAPIGKKRLLARPETTYCIICKEEQERQEKMFQKKRQMRATIEF